MNANSKIHMLGKIRDFILINTAIVLYETMILPYLEFGNIFLPNGWEADIDRLLKT